MTANLTLDLLLAIAADVLERPPERMIASGVLAVRDDESPRRSRATACARRTGASAASGRPWCWSARDPARGPRPRADAEVVLAELLELAPGGLEERDLDDGASST